MLLMMELTESTGHYAMTSKEVFNYMEKREPSMGYTEIQIANAMSINKHKWFNKLPKYKQKTRGNCIIRELKRKWWSLAFTEKYDAKFGLNTSDSNPVKQEESSPTDPNTLQISRLWTRLNDTKAHLESTKVAYDRAVKDHEDAQKEFKDCMNSLGGRR